MQINRWRLEWQDVQGGPVHSIEKKVLGGSASYMLEKLKVKPAWVRVSRRPEGEWENVHEKEMN